MGTITHILESYGLIAVGLLIFLEDFGVPLPGETILITSSVAASQHRLNILLVALVAVLAAIAGDNVGWLIGRYGGRRVLYVAACRVRVRGRFVFAPSKLRRGERFVQQRGPWIITVARFFDILRQVNGIIAGAMKVRWPVFLLFNVLGAVLWVGAWSSVGYFAGSAVGPDRIDRLILYVLLGITGLAITAYLVRLLIRKLRHRSEDETPAAVEERICQEERG
jgi:membrane protein DedA with SNARE-associated domain